MADLDEVRIFSNNKSTLKKTTHSEQGDMAIYMTESNLEVIDFDAVKREYMRGIISSESPTSCDALFVDNRGKYYLIEFKSGYISKTKSYEIWLKILDSMLIALDILNKGISFSREAMSFILVYNEGKNPQDAFGDGMQVSDSRTAIAEHFIERKAKKKYIRFNLERFEKLYFKDVYTYSEEAFESEFVVKHS